MDYKVTDAELTSVADAIRTKGGTSAPLEWTDGFVSAINDIQTGGGGDDCEYDFYFRQGGAQKSIMPLRYIVPGKGTYLLGFVTNYSNTRIGLYINDVEISNASDTCYLLNVLKLEKNDIVEFRHNTLSSSSNRFWIQFVLQKCNFATDPFSQATDFLIEHIDKGVGALNDVIREYPDPIYNNTALITKYGAVLLADAKSNSADSVTLSDSLSNYAAVILQGVYGSNATSNYNTSIAVVNPQLNKPYWAGMKDRNDKYDCFVSFTNDTTAALTGSKHCVIYGVPASVNESE